MTTTAPTDVSASTESMAATISATIGAVSVLRSSGLLRVRVATPSVTSTRTRVMEGKYARAAGRGQAAPAATTAISSFHSGRASSGTTSRVEAAR